VFLLGGGIFVFGGLTFAIIGRTFTFDSAAVFGVALMLSGLLLLKRNPLVDTVTQVLFLLLLSCNIVYTFIQGDRSHQAAQFQKTAFTSLLDVGPDVEDQTSFIFLDAKALMGGSHVIHFMPQIIYNNQTLHGGFAYSGKATKQPTLVVTRDRIKADSPLSDFTPPLDRLIILKLQDDGIFEIVDLRKADPLNAVWAESYFELTKESLWSLAREGLPGDIRKHLKLLKHRAFFEKEFLKAVEEHIGKEETEKYQALILKHAWSWTETYFELTEQNMQNLRDEGVPEGILTWLERHVKHRAFPTEDEFLEAAEDYIGKEARDRYGDLFVKYARKEVNSITELKSNTSLIKQKRVENAFTKYLTSLPD